MKALKKFSERTQRLILMSKRRSSDASVSDNKNEKSAAGKKCSSLSKRRQQFRKRRQEGRPSVEAVEIVAENETELKTSASKIYDELLVGRSPVDAFYVFLATLRQYFVRQTWNDCVEKLLKEFLCRHILVEASKLLEKYDKKLPNVPLNQKLDEFKLQVLLHLFTIPSNVDESLSFANQDLEIVVNLLRMIGFIYNHKVMSDFLDEDVYDIFVDSLPKHLAQLYDELNQPMPPDLKMYASNEENHEASFFEPVVIPSPVKAATAKIKTEPFVNEESNQSCSSQGNRGFKRTHSFFDNKHHKTISIPSSGCKKLKMDKKKLLKKEEGEEQKTVVDQNLDAEAIEPKKVKNSRRSLNYDSVDESSTCTRIKPSCSQSERRPPPEARTPSSKRRTSVKLVPDTPAFHQIEFSEKRRREMRKLTKQRGESRRVVSETPPKLWAKIPIRASPRQHASTRALYSCVPNLLSQLQTGDDDGFLMELMDSEDDDDKPPKLSPNSPKFILIKAKKGYAVKSSERSSKLSKTPSRTPATSGKKSKLVNSFIEKTPMLFPIDEREDIAGLSSTPAASSSPVKKLKRNLSKSFLSPDKSRISPPPLLSCLVDSAKLELTDSVKNKKTLNSTPSKDVQNGKSCKVSTDKTKNGKNILKKNGGSFVADVESQTETRRKLRGPGFNELKRQNSSASADYNLPQFALENYELFMGKISKERNAPAGSEELFYGRGTRRNSIFYENPNNPTASTFYADELKAPKNRTGRKMKSSVEYFHLANYLLNANNKNPSGPQILKNLQKTVNTPIKLNKKLRLASKNGRKRAKLQLRSTSTRSSPLAASASNSGGDESLQEKADDKIMLQKDMDCFPTTRLFSTDTDFSEELGSGGTPSPKSLVIDLDGGNVAIGANEELQSVDICSPRLRLRSSTAKDRRTSCSTMNNVKHSPLDDLNVNNACHSRNIFDWARSLNEEEVFSTTPPSTLSTAPTNFGALVI